MVYGYFLNGTNVPYIEVSIFSGKKILSPAFVLDTGFSGDLKIDKRMADQLGVAANREIPAINANGERILAGLSPRYVEMEGRKKLIDILIFDGAPLVGIGLFSAFGYTVVVDCKNRTAHLESTI